MRYTRLLVALGVLCLLAIPVLSAQAENGLVKNCNENGCQNGNACKLGPQDGTGIQNANGQIGNQQGARDGSGPKRDGSCGNCKR